MGITTVVPLIIHGKDITPVGDESVPIFTPNPDNAHNHNITAVGATPELCIQAVESCAEAFKTWKNSHPTERRKLFNRLAELFLEKREELLVLIQEEISCSSLWAHINIEDTIAIAEGIAATVTSGVLSGIVPIVNDPDAHAVVIKEPFGVVLGIAPWNAPLILGLRAVAAAVAAGNTVILKGSEMSPRIHYLIAQLFREANFPPGVVNYIQHRPEDASKCFEAIISHKAVQKCNFTGSTVVGRQIAKVSAFHLKPVLLELGGKNFSIVLEDADLEKAADAVLFGALINSGQVCMCTDLVLVAQEVQHSFRELLFQKMSGHLDQVTDVINVKSRSRIEALVKNAKDNGATVTSSEAKNSTTTSIIENMSPDMDFWSAESFGPLLGMRAFDTSEDAIRMVNESSYGLSAAIFSRNHLQALKIAKQLDTGAVHVNSSTVHDESGLPHGGRKESGWGRFGGSWAFEEFLQTKTIILHP